MASTTNYNWTTPDDTALVKDGAAAIRSLGTAIDTTVFNNAGAAIAKTIVDAKGDIIAATAADTVARLAVGANNTVLTADSSTATGLKWAAASSGSFTKIASGSFSAVGAVNIDTIFSATYKNYFMILSKLGSADSPFNQDLLLQYRYSGTTDTTANYYGSNYNQERSNAATTNGWTAATSNRLMPDVGGGGSMVGIYFSGVGNTSESAKMYANYFGSANQDLGMSSGLLTSSQTFTGIRLSCSSNITGEYAVYGLEN